MVSSWTTPAPGASARVAPDCSAAALVLTLTAVATLSANAGVAPAIAAATSEERMLDGVRMSPHCHSISGSDDICQHPQVCGLTSPTSAGSVIAAGGGSPTSVPPWPSLCLVNCAVTYCPSRVMLAVWVPSDTVSVPLVLPG